MTVSNQNQKSTGTGNGTSHQFNFNFKIALAADLVVLVRTDATGATVTKTLNTDYIIPTSSIAADAGGNILFKFNTGTSTDAHFDTTDRRPPAGTTVILKRQVQLTQGVDLQAASSLPAETLENAYDKVTHGLQQLQEQMDRALLRPASDSTTAALPDTVDLKGKVLQFNSSTGVPEAVAGLTDNATSSTPGLMSAADKSKLDGIEAGATGDQDAAEIRTLVESATDSNVFTDADHTKLNNIENNATADQTDSEIRAAVASATDSNVFTDADHTKLDGIETGATADQTDAEIKIAYENNSDTNAFSDAEKTKLSGIETGATADQNASDIRGLGFFDTTNDGTGSGLDADKLDGQEGTYYQQASTALTTSTSFGGDVSGTYNAIVIADDSHNHVISNVDGLQDALNAKAPLASPALTGTPSAPTAAADTSTTQIATTAFVQQELTALVDSAPNTLNTLNEIAAAINDDPNFNTTVTNALGNRLRIDVNNQGLTATQKTNAVTNLGLATVATSGAYSDISGTPTNATTSAAGLMSSADKTKLNGIEDNATADQTASEIKTLYENNSNTNAFTDALLNKLNAIEASATADQTAAEIRTLVESATDSNVFTDADHTKLNGIESNATADQTATEILTAIKTVDGATSGLDSDLLDGQHGSHYLDYNNFTNVPTLTTTLSALTDTTITSVGDNDLIAYDSGSSKFINQTPAEAGFATVATSGSYNDLSNTPTIPSNNNQLSNGAGYVTSSGNVASADTIKTTKISSGNTFRYLTMVDANNTTATAETLETDVYPQHAPAINTTLFSTIQTFSMRFMNSGNAIYYYSQDNTTDAVKIFYDDDNSDFEIELESPADSLKITDNGTDRFVFTKSNGTLTATTFVGALTGNASTATSATSATSASVADQVKTESTLSSSFHYLTFVDSNNSSATAETLYTKSGIYVTPSQSKLNVSVLEPYEIRFREVEATGANKINFRSPNASNVITDTVSFSYNDTNNDFLIQLANGADSIKIQDGTTDKITLASDGTVTASNYVGNFNGQAASYYLDYNNFTNTPTIPTGDITGVTAGTGLSGGGDSGSVTLDVDLSELTDMTQAMVGTDEFIVLDNGADRRKAANEIPLSIFNNDSSFTANANLTDITGGIEIAGGIVSVKNTGTRSEVRLYCETTNQHYQALRAPAHSTFPGSGNFTMDIPPGNGTLLSTLSNLSDLANVATTSPSTGEVLKWNGSAWEPGTDSGGGGSVSSLTDVSLSSLSNGQVLKYNSNTSKWENAADATGGGGGSATNADTVDNYHLSVVASMPSSPDSNTIYFVTG